MEFTKIFSWPKNILIFLLIFLPAPLFSGLHTDVIFFINSSILAAFFLWICECSISGRRMLLNVNYFKVALTLFIVFIAYVFIQSISGLTVLTRLWPGSVQPHETTVNAFQLLFYFFFFLLCLDFFSNRRRMFLIVPVFAVQVLFLTAVGYYQKLFDFKLMYGFYAPPPPAPFYSSFLNENHYGVYLAMVSLLFLSSIVYYLEIDNLRKKTEWRLIRNIFYLALLAVMTGSIFNAEARTGFLCQLVIFVVFLLSCVSKDNRKRAFFLLFLLSVLIGVAIYFFFPHLLKQAYSELPQNLSGRLVLDRETYHLWRDFPLFGIGLGSYRWIYKMYQVFAAESVAHFYALNDHLELLAECGFLGYFLFVFSLFILALFSLRNCLNSRSHWSRTMGMASFVVIAAIAVVSFFDYYLKTPAIAMLFAMYLAILVRCATFYSDEDHEGEKAVAVGDMQSRFFRFVSIFFVVILLAISLQHVRREYLSQKVFDGIPNSPLYDTKKSLTAEEAERLMTEELKDLERAVDMNPKNPLGWSFLGQLYYGRVETAPTEDFEAVVAKCINAYEMATDLAPTYPDYWMTLGMARIRSGKYLDGLQDIRHGVELAPLNRDVILYAIIAHLKVEEFSVWESEKTKIRHRALALVGKTFLLPNPLTISDHDYINRSSRLWQQSITPEDNAQISALIKEFNQNS